MKYRRSPIYRHSLVTRVTHGVFFLAFLGLIVSGTALYFRAHWLPANPVRLHEYLGLTMIGCGVVYFTSAFLNGTLSKLLFTSSDVRGLVPMIAYYARLRKTPPQYADYNPLQKLAYTLVLLTMGPLMAATGLAMWPHAAVFRPLAQFFGGRKDVTLWHLGFALELVLFFAGHMVMVATTGLRKNLRAIITGWYYPGPAAATVRSAPTAERTRRGSVAA